MSTEQVKLTAEDIKANNLVLKVCSECKAEFYGVEWATEKCGVCFAAENGTWI